MRLQISLCLLYAALTKAIPTETHSGTTTLLSQLSTIPSTIVRQSGLNFSPCTTDSSCVGDRVCVSQTNGQVSSCTTDCVCLPPSINPSTFSCTSATDCATGETCVQGPRFALCVAEDAVPTLNIGAEAAPEKPTRVSSGNGLTGDACSSDDECTAPRTCETSPGGGLCVPPDPVSCDEDDDCVEGEVCIPIQPDIICVSEVVVNADVPSTRPPTSTAESPTDPPVTTVGTTTAADESTATTVPPSTTDVTKSSQVSNDDSVDTDTGGDASDSDDTDEPSPDTDGDSEEESVPANGLSLDPCQNSDTCGGSRSCVDLSDGTSCSAGDDCRCFPDNPVPCDDDSTCDEGEGCFNIRDVDQVSFLPEELQDADVCISRAARDDAVCIAAHSLAHISREQLVFEKDAVAHVLCDVNDSCATPGHMVQYKGEGMMMKSYCELTSCVRKVMKVNSPKYRRGLTVPSHTEDMVFTALAARFQTRGEEGVLSVAVRFGF